MMHFKSNSSSKAIIFLSLFFGLSSLWLVWRGDPESVISYTDEDGLVENLTAIFYLIGFLICLLSIKQNRIVYLAIIWAFLCFLFLGEETSWFQRIFHYSVPSVEQINDQHEFNIHNLEILKRNSAREVIKDGFNINNLIKLLSSPQMIFQMGYFSYFLIFPFVNQSSTINALKAYIGYKKPDTGFIFTLIFLIFLSFVLSESRSSADIKSAAGEVREMLYAYFILIYVIFYVKESHDVDTISPNQSQTEN
jgi:hypothetical protein